MAFSSRGTYYESQGVGDPVFLVIGFGQDTSAWQFVAPMLENRQVVVMDNRGCGQSPHPVEPFSLEDLADDVSALADELRLHAIDMVGQSMGGAIVQTVALRRPDLVNRIVLVNSFSKVATAQGYAFESLGRLLEHGASLEDVVRSLCPWVYSSEFLAPPGTMEAIVAAAQAAPPQPVHSYFNQMNALRAFDSTSWLTEIGEQTLVIAGDQDLIVPLPQSRELARRLPNAELEVITSGHGSHIEKPAEVAAAIQHFL